MAIRFLAGEEVTGTTTFKSGVTGVTTDTIAIFGQGAQAGASSSGFELYEGSGIKLASYNLGIRVHGFIRAEDGANGTPAYTFASDSTTGMYLTNGGNLRLVNDGEICFTVRTNQNVEINNGTLKIGSIPAGASSNSFLINEGNIVKSRTAAEVRSDIGAGTGDGTVTGSGTAKNLTMWATGGTGIEDSPIKTELVGTANLNKIIIEDADRIVVDKPSSVTSGDPAFQVAQDGTAKVEFGWDDDGGGFGFVYNYSGNGIKLGAAGNNPMIEVVTTANAESVNLHKQLELKDYGSGTYTGTSAYYLIADSSGNVIEKTPAQVRSDIGAGTGSGTVTGVSGTAPIVSSGGTAPAISINNATGTTVGAAAVDAGIGISVSDSNGVYTVANSGMISWTVRGDSGSDISIGNGGTVDIAGGTGISTSLAISGVIPTLTITNDAPDQTVSLTPGTGISITGTYPNFTITNSSPSSGGTIGGSGTANKVAKFTAGSTLGNGPITFSGNNSSFAGTLEATSIGSTTQDAANIFKGSVISSVATSALGLILRNSSDNSIIGSLLRTSATTSELTTDSLNLPGTTSQYIRGDGSAATFPSTGLTGSGTTNFISKWSSSSALTNSEISDTGSVIQLGLDASNNSTLYLDTTNRKVGFRTTSPGAAFDVNGTIRVRNQLNVGETTEQNLYVNGGSGGQYVKMGNYGNSNYFGLTSSENQPKYTAAFGPNGKIVEDRRVMTVKISASAINTYHTDAGVQIIPSPGSGNIIWPMNIFIYRGAGDPGTGWPSGNNSIGASFYMCDQVNTCSSLNRIANIASGVCKSNTGTWFWGRPVPLPSLNENPNIKWLLDNKNLRFKTAANISNATMDWYVRIEYLQMNITAGFTNNVDATIT